MIADPAVRKDVIRQHYDLVTPFYWLLWGRHIHHGLWQADEKPAEAQQRLTETLAALAGIAPDQAVLDVGCGMGGSSIHLAKQLGCQVTGITLSRVQRRWAAVSSRWHRVGRRTTFRCVDAEEAEFPSASFDVVWSVECTEHLFDKESFFRRASQWLRPGGRLAICAWLAGEGTLSPQQIREVEQVCEGFFCPSLGTAGDYRQWIEDAGLKMVQYADWTERVARTWEVCLQRVQRTGLGRLAPWIDRNAALFVDRFQAILDAYRSGAMQYGCFVAEKPAEG